MALFDQSKVSKILNNILNDVCDSISDRQKVQILCCPFTEPNYLKIDVHWNEKCSTESIMQWPASDQSISQ